MDAINQTCSLDNSNDWVYKKTGMDKNRIVKIVRDDITKWKEFRASLEEDGMQPQTTDKRTAIKLLLEERRRRIRLRIGCVLRRKLGTEKRNQE